MPLKTVYADRRLGGFGAIEVNEGKFYLPLDNTWQTLFFLLAGSMLVFSALLFITYQLKLVFSTLRNNEPFDEGNIKRINNIGIAFIIFSILKFLSNVLITQFLQSHFALGKELVLTYSFDISYLIAGIVLIIAAGIFKEGSKLKEETNLTI